MIKIMLAAALALSLGLPPRAAAQGAASPSVRPLNKSAVPPAESGSTIVEYSGRVAVARKGVAKAVAVKSAPFALQEGDTVGTGGDGSAVLKLGDSSEIRLDPGSRFVLSEESPAAVSLILSIGKLWAQVAKGRTRSFEVRTPLAVAAVRGTSFSVEATAARMGITEVYEGAVAVAALKNNAPSGPEALLMAGQRIEASHGKLGEVRAVVRPLNPQEPAAAPKGKAELKKALKTLKAEAEQAHDADRAAAASSALKSGDEAKMRAAAQALESGAGMTAEQKTSLASSFAQGHSLTEIMPAAVEQPAPQAVPPPATDNQISKAKAGWNVNRELGLQLHDQALRSLTAKGSISSSASPASAQVTMAAYQQQYTQNYLSGQQAGQEPAAGGGGAAPPPTSAAPTTSALQPPTSPTSPVFQNSTNPNQPPPPPPSPGGGGNCTCTAQAGCVCH